MASDFQILVVDDDESTRAFLHSVLTAEGYRCQMAADVETAERMLHNGPVHLALVDLYLGTANGLNVLDLIKVLQPQCACVMMTAHATVETVARSVAGGALEYLGKPLMIEDLLALVGKVEAGRRSSPRSVVGEDLSPASSIMGSSPKMLEVYRAIARVAPTNAPVLIIGASGTGKELVARAIHQHSTRATKPFVPVNCGAFAENILERLTSLRGSAHSGRYRAPPVRRVHIPKGTGSETRPIGIPTFEDKVHQRAVVMLLVPIYEGMFHAGSFGFRPGRNAERFADYHFNM